MTDAASMPTLPLPPSALRDPEFCREGPNGRLWLAHGHLYVEAPDGEVRRAYGKDLDAPPRPKKPVKTNEGGKMPAATKSRPKSPDWKSLPDAEKAAHLLAKTTIPDRAHTNKKRRKDEDRASFIRRIYGVSA